MENTPKEVITGIWEQQRHFFAIGETRSIDFRMRQLKKFKDAVIRYEKRITDALWSDLHKSREEAYLTEISLVLVEIDYHLKHLKRWAKPHKVKTPLHSLPSRGKILYEPLGHALIIAPWNYPFQLLMNPLVGAISAGCCALLKPSPHAPAIAEMMELMVREIFPSGYIDVVQGNRDVNTLLLEMRFDMIFFTGSPSMGKIVMRAASEYLTPVLLELGGKSPCIVDADANIERAAQRIAWGKTVNAGQTCIAPDYLFAHHSIKEKLLERIAFHIDKMYGPDIQQSLYFPRIVNSAAMERLQKLMLHGKIVYGGQVDTDEKYIAPTIIDEVSPDFPIMQEEIFGPILPVMTFDKIQETADYMNVHEKPLAFYYFGKNAAVKDILQKTTSGGACINDTIMHVANHHLPFGGVGNSGMGKYHGKSSFRAFCNARAVLTTPTWIELPVKQPPFKYFNLIRKFI
ncbi:MAG: aldehyde dehydrogenase [Prolixibacteraceae bacterium]|nr:aldehyde dehydrogenase [Prolixibacteraceae bacterium]